MNSSYMSLKVVPTSAPFPPNITLEKKPLLNSIRCFPRNSLLLMCFAQTSHLSRIPSWTASHELLGTPFFWSASHKHHTRVDPSSWVSPHALLDTPLLWNPPCSHHSGCTFSSPVEPHLFYDKIRGRYSPSYSRSKIEERNVPFSKVRKKFKILVKFWPVLTFEFCKSELWFKSYAFLTFSILGGLSQRSFAFFSSFSMVF